MIAVERVKCIIADVMKNAKSVAGFSLPRLSSQMNDVTKHGLATKTVSKWQPSKSLLTRRG